jgi:hypothetical protein
LGRHGSLSYLSSDSEMHAGDFGETVGITQQLVLFKPSLV